MLKSLLAWWNNSFLYPSPCPFSHTSCLLYHHCSYLSYLRSHYHFISSPFHHARDHTCLYPYFYLLNPLSSTYSPLLMHARLSFTPISIPIHATNFFKTHKTHPSHHFPPSIPRISRSFIVDCPTYVEPIAHGRPHSHTSVYPVTIPSIPTEPIPPNIHHFLILHACQPVFFFFSLDLDISCVPVCELFHQEETDLIN